MNLKGGGAQNLKSAFVHVVFFTLKPKKGLIVNQV